MNNKIRVFVVDDSSVIRRLLTSVIADDPEFEVVGTAANGRLALAKLATVQPDVVTLDVEMPELDGVATLREIRKLYPRLPVVMFSTLTARGATTTLDALAAGASDYVTKPANVGSVVAGMQAVREQLVPKLKALCGRATASGALGLAGRAAALTAAKPPLPARRPPAVPSRIDLVAIGCSTGGPNALQDVLGLLPAQFPVPVVIVQHMPPVFTSYLAQRLTSKCRLPVHEASDGQALLPGQAFLAPGGFHLTVARREGRLVLRTNEDPPENSCRPAVDVLFRSVADLYGAHLLAVILTGMGQDGLIGCQKVVARGGRVIAQDEATSVVWGMPGAVAAAGLHEALVPLAQIGPEIVRIVSAGRAAAAGPALALAR